MKSDLHYLEIAGLVSIMVCHFVAHHLSNNDIIFSETGFLEQSFMELTVVFGRKACTEMEYQKI